MIACICCGIGEVAGIVGVGIVFGLTWLYNRLIRRKCNCRRIDAGHRAGGPSGID
jgi:hypothetical protein